MALQGPIQSPAQTNGLRRKLIGRLVIALALIGIAVVGLEWLDRSMLRSGGKQRSVAVESPPSKPEVRASDAKAEDGRKPEEPPPPPVVEAVPTIAAEPEQKAEAKPEPESKDVAEAPAGRRPARGSDAERAPRTVEPAKREAEKATVRAPAKAETASPAAKPAAASEPPAKPPRGFAVQLGVFTAPANAEELRARLVANGVPAYTETRVQVGPFRDRAEAESMREKLRAMGLAPVLVPVQ